MLPKNLVTKERFFHPMKQAFLSFSSYNYRVWAIGGFASNIGSWMQRVAQDWLVLMVLTDHSSVAVGITTGLHFGPMLVLGPYAGLLADRWCRRRLLMLTQTLMALSALALAALLWAGKAQLWQVFLLAGVLGVTTAFDAPARQSFLSELVPQSQLPNAIGLNSASFNGARIFGPGLAGLAIATWGVSLVFLINALSFIVVLGMLRIMKLDQLYSVSVVPRAAGQIKDGLGYVRKRPELWLVLVIVGMVSTFGLNFSMTTAIMATQVFHKGPLEYGALGSVMAIGALIGSLLAARRTQPRLRLIVGSAAFFGGCASLAAVMPTYGWFAISLIPVGIATQTLLNSATTLIQLGVDPKFRGRVMALYLMVVLGGSPFGSPLMGWIGQTYNPRWTILLGGVIACATAGSAAIFVAWNAPRQTWSWSRKPVWARGITVG